MVILQIILNRAVTLHVSNMSERSIAKVAFSFHIKAAHGGGAACGERERGGYKGESGSTWDIWPTVPMRKKLKRKEDLIKLFFFKRNNSLNWYNENNFNGKKRGLRWNSSKHLKSFILTSSRDYRIISWRP